MLNRTITRADIIHALTKEVGLRYRQMEVQG